MTSPRSFLSIFVVLLLAIVPSASPFWPASEAIATESCAPSSDSFVGDGTYGTSGVAYQVLIFKSVGACNWAVPSGVTRADLLIIGGGGGGFGLAGGGAGEYVQRSNQSVAGSIAITVGNGGSSGNSGGSSSFDTSIVAGGGGAAAPRASHAANNASGGSAGGSSIDTGTPGQSIDDGDPNSFGNRGALGYYHGSGTVIGGPGGGAGAAPSNATYPTSIATSLGGPGKASTIITSQIAGDLSVGEVVSSQVYFAGGGAGGCGNAGCGSTNLVGGNGGGGNGSSNYSPESGQPATGGGGGGTNTWEGVGGAGGSGVVIVRYALIPESPTSISVSSLDGGLVSLTQIPPTGVGGLSHFNTGLMVVLGQHSVRLTDRRIYLCLTVPSTP